MCYEFKMPKAILEFELPEEQDDFDYANNGSKYYCQIAEIYELLRKYRKYIELNEIESKFFEKIQDEILEILKD